jgi:hypothetical protein
MGMMTRPCQIRMDTVKPEMVVFMLTSRYRDIAEEDDGQVFSTNDWPQIEKVFLDSTKKPCLNNLQEDGGEDYKQLEFAFSFTEGGRIPWTSGRRL